MAWLGFYKRKGSPFKITERKYGHQAYGHQGRQGNTFGSQKMREGGRDGGLLKIEAMV